MSTIYQIAAAAGVSPNTVSRVLNGKLKGNYPKVAKKAERILQIAERLNYRPNAAARAIQSQRTRQVGILLRNENTKAARFINLAAFEIVLGIHERLKQDGYLATVVPIGEVRDLAGESRVFREHLIDGMIVVGNTPGGASPSCWCGG